jgi:NADP-dependent 3-hydroxy acid dehydrogenase YdfG
VFVIALRIFAAMQITTSGGMENNNNTLFEDSGRYSLKNMPQPKQIAALISHIVEPPDNFGVDEITMMPSIPDLLASIS